MNERLNASAFTSVAYGGGTDSTAMLVHLVAEGIRPNRILFADPGAEMPHTYRYIGYFHDWLLSHGFPGITIVYKLHKQPRAGTPWTKGERVRLEDVYRHNRTLPPPCFPRGPRTCSIRSKVEPQQEYIASLPEVQALWSRGEKVLQLVGFEAGEDHRVKRCNPYAETEHYSLAFPLIDWGMDRAACIREIAAAGLEQPGKSACFFCPHRKRAEVEELKRDYPELFKRGLELEAIGMESGKIKADHIKGLGGRWSWTELEEEDDSI